MRLPPPAASGFHCHPTFDSSRLQMVEGCGFHWFGLKSTFSTPASEYGPTMLQDIPGLSVMSMVFVLTPQRVSSSRFV